jgi:hypothetical protein
LTFSDFNLHWVYKPTSKDRIKVSALRSASVLDFDSDISEPEFDFWFRSIQEREVEQQGTGTEWEHQWDDATLSSISVAHSTYKLDYFIRNQRERFSDSFDEIHGQNNRLENLEIRAQIQFNPTSSLSYIFGYQQSHIRTHAEIFADTRWERDYRYVLDPSTKAQAWFFSFKEAFNDDWTVDGSIRLNQFERQAQFVWDKHIGSTYRLNEQVMLKASYGLYHQYLSALEETGFTFSNATEQMWLISGKQNTQPVLQNRQGVVGMLFQHKGWTADLDIYHKDMTGKAARNVGTIYDGIDPRVAGTERINGVDLTIKKGWKRLRAWVSYSHQHSKVNMPLVSDEFFASGFNSRHQLQLSLNYQLRKWQFSMGYTLKSGLPFTQGQDLGYRDEPFPDDDPDEFEAFHYIEYSEINEIRLPTYHRLDASLWYTFLDKPQKQLHGEFGISMLNILNSQNPYRRNFGIDEHDEDEFVMLVVNKYTIRRTLNASVRIAF